MISIEIALKKIKNNFDIAIFGLIILIFNIILSKYSFPISEGWWETYAWLDQKKPLYSETKLPFPPLFIIIQNIFLKITDNFYYLRIIYCLIALVEFLLMVNLIKIIGYKRYAVAGAFFANVLIIIQNPVWIVKDYHIIVTILELLFLKYYYILNNGEYKSNICDALKVGIILGCIYLLKQNIAVILTIFILVIAFIEYKFNPVKQHRNLRILFFTACSLIIFTLFYGSGWLESYIGNDSKGGVLRVFLRLIEDNGSRKILLNSIIIYISLLIIFKVYSNLKLTNTMGYYDSILEGKSHLKIIFYGHNTIFIFIIIAIIGFGLLGNTSTLFVLTLAFVFFHLSFYKNCISKFNFYLFLLGIIYTGTMTAGFNTVSMQIPIAIFIAFLFSYLAPDKKYIKYTILISLFLFSNYGFYKNKFIEESYNWWGYSLSSIQDSNYYSDIEKLNGIKFDKNTIEILKETSKVMQDEEATLLSFPSIPIFYYLYNRLPIVASPVLWFDVFPSKYLESTLGELIKKQPDYVFWLQPTRHAYEGHSILKQSKLPIKEIESYLEMQISSGKYQIIYIKPIVSGNDPYGSRIYLKDITKKINNTFNCNFCDIKFMDNLINTGQIDSYSAQILPGNVEISFRNKYLLADFIEKYKIRPLNSDISIFYIIKKIN